MKNNTFLKAVLIFGGLALISWGLDQYFKNSSEADPANSPEGRVAYELARIVDPTTGELPENIRIRELRFAQTLPVAGSQRDSLALDFQSIGPYNVGGRTRAFAVDITNPNIYLAGAVSGGMWRSTTQGQSWERVTTPGQHAATSCIVQDKRDGFTNTWYYGSGESVGNSASKSFSAYYHGSGIYKSTDKGITWNLLPNTQAKIQTESDWEVVHNMVVDKTRMDSSIVYAATKKGIMRSSDGGDNWTNVLGGNNNADFTHIIQNHSGVLYATISFEANSSGFYRSENGLNWTSIKPSNHPNNHERTVMASPDSSDNFVFFYSETTGIGNNGLSLWKYNYLSGNGAGAGGEWINLSSNLDNINLSVQGGYSQAIAVKPDNPNALFIGGTSLYRSISGFQDTLNTTRIGGYSIDGFSGYSFRDGTHYPDQQLLVFHPENDDILFSTNDGGAFRANDCMQAVMSYDKLNNGYVSAQFYALGIDHATAGSKEVIGGLQDRGTFYSNHADPNQDWISARGADGAYSAISNGGEFYYASTQYANIRRYSEIDGDDVNVMPEGMSGGFAGGWQFVHPFILDPADNKRMYLPNQGEVLRNNDVTGIQSVVGNSWEEIASVSGTITTISSSESNEGVVYFGTNSGRIYRLVDAHILSNPSPELIVSGITSSGYTSCIAIDPENADRAIVVYSNYNVISLYLTEDGGQSWIPIEGNLKGNPEPGLPEQFYYRGDGPSIRWAEIMHVGDEGEIVLLGTSVGVFSTRLLDGDNTVWKQEGANTVGNVVVDMIDYRVVDNWIVLATHGNGMYTSNIGFVEYVGVEENEKSNGVSLFPNPVRNVINVNSGSNSSLTSLKIYSMGGELILESGNSKSIDVSRLPSGLYILNGQVSGKSFAKRFVKL